MKNKSYVCSLKWHKARHVVRLPKIDVERLPNPYSSCQEKLVSSPSAHFCPKKDRCLLSLHRPANLSKISHSCCLYFPSSHLILDGPGSAILSLVCLQLLRSSQ